MRLSHKLSFVIKPSIACAILCLQPQPESHEPEREAFKIEEVREITCSGFANRIVGDGIEKADEELMSFNAPSASSWTV